MWKRKRSPESEKTAEAGQEDHTSAEDDGRKVKTKKKRHRPQWLKACLPIRIHKKSKKVGDAYEPTSASTSTSKNNVTSPVYSKRDSLYDNHPSSEKTEAAEIHESPTRESQEVKSENVPKQKKTQKIIDVKPIKVPIERSEENERKNCENVSSVKPRETEMVNYQRTTHVPASMASTSAAQSFCEVDSASRTKGVRSEKSAEDKPQYVKTVHVDPHHPPMQSTHVHTQNDQLSLTPHHTVQHSSNQESVPSHKAEVPYNVQPENNPPSLSLSKVEDDRGGRQQELVYSVSNCDPMPGILTMNEELKENKSCLVKIAGHVNKTDEKTSEYETFHDTTTDNIEERSVENLSYPKPPVDLSTCTNPNSVGLSQEADSFVKDNSAPVLLSSTASADSIAAAHIESSIEEEEDKKTVDNTLLVDTGDAYCTVEQQPEIIVRPTMNLNSILVNDQDEGESSIEEEDMKTVDDILLVDMKTVDDTLLVDMKTVDDILLVDTGYSCCTVEQEPEIVRPTMNLKSILVNDQDENESSIEEEDMKTVDDILLVDMKTVDDTLLVDMKTVDDNLLVDMKTVDDILLVDTGDACCTVEQQPEIIVRPTMNLKSILVNDQDEDKSSIEVEDMKTVDNTLLVDTRYSGCTVEQEPEIVTPAMNLELIKTDDQDKDGFADDTQTECEIDENMFTEIKEVDEKTGNDLIWENSHAVQNSFETQPDGDLVESVGELIDTISKVDETNGDFMSVDGEANYWKQALFDETCYWKTAVFGDDVETKIVDAVEDKRIVWKEILYDDICDWKNADLGEDVETVIEENVEDEENDWKKILPIEDWRTADFGEWDETNDWMSEDKQNELEAGVDDKTELERTEISYNSSDIDSLETNSTEESVGGLLTNIHSGRPEESILRPPKGNEPDLNMVERDDCHRDEEEQGNALAQRRERETERQDIANVQQNTETRRVNDHGEKGVSSPTASALQTPVEKVPAVTATEGKNQSSKRSKEKDTSKETAKTMRPVGLQNLGNTCFFNAVMQNLNQSFLLYEVLDKEGCRLSLTKSMLGFYKQMGSGTSHTVNPYQVLSDICKRSPRFAGGRQQDSHELLRHLLDGLRTEERESSVDPNNRKVLTRVDKVFGGHFMTVYTCSDCKTPYHVCEPLLDISLPISNEAFQTDEESSVDEEDGEVSLEDDTGDHVTYQKAAESLMTPLAIGQKQEAQDDRNESISEVEVPQNATKKKGKNKRKNKNKFNGQQSATKKCKTEGRSILDCLDVFTRTEHIADEYLCMACHAERVNQGATDYQMTSAKKRTLIYNPPALLTLHLKRFRQTDYGFTKCNDTISYPDMIDIAPYCSSWCLRNEGQETSIWYSLYGLVVHGGSLDGGHYVAYVKLRETEENIRQFLQESYLDRDQLTEEELVITAKQMHALPTKPDEKEKWQPQPLKGRWFYVSDSHCSEVSEDAVWRQQAYLLFYERRQGNTVPPNKSVLYQRSVGTSV